MRTLCSKDDMVKAEKCFLKGNQINRLSLNQLKQLCDIFTIGSDELRKSRRKKPIIEALENLRLNKDAITRVQRISGDKGLMGGATTLNRCPESHNASAPGPLQGTSEANSNRQIIPLPAHAVPRPGIQSLVIGATNSVPASPKKRAKISAKRVKLSLHEDLNSFATNTPSESSLGKRSSKTKSIKKVSSKSKDPKKPDTTTTIASVRVKVFNNVKAWHHEREEFIPLNHNGDLNLRELENILGFTGQYRCQVFNPQNHRVVDYASSVLANCDLRYLTRNVEFVCLLKVKENPGLLQVPNC